MKNVIYYCLCALMAFTALSCGKTQSNDFPLPVVRKEAVFICTDNNNLISYDPYTGAKHWEVNFKGNSRGVPVLWKKKLYLVTNNGYFYAVDVLKGKISLEVNITNSSDYSLAVENDRLYMASDKLYCYDLNGTLVWQYDPLTPCTASPTLVNGKVYVPANDRIHAVDAGSGSGVWTSPSAGGINIQSSPRVSNGLVYFGGENKKIYALQQSDGSVRWEYLTGDRIKSSPLVYGGMCICGSEDFGLYCIDTTSPTLPPNGELRWKYTTLDRISSSPAVHEASNTIIVGGYDFNLYAIDHVSGLLKWKYPAGSLIKSSPLVYGNYIFFTSYDRYLYCVDVRYGNTVWKSYINGNTDSSPMADDMTNGVYPTVSGMSKY
ncbi:MAG TPA: PQQ-binding-like beta-propeller repeat protein [Chitinophagaceae bacterium]|nr:PQQ-binding-like beta-propeller repeat protein [Chitinophagaceae bacterium]